MRGAEILQISQRQDADSGEHVARLPRSGIKHGDDIHTAFFKHGQVYQRAPEIPRTDDNGIEALPDREYLADLGKQVTDIVSVALLPEAAKAVEILPYLRCGHVHQGGQLAGRDAGTPLRDQFPQVAIVARQTSHHGGGHRHGTSCLILTVFHHTAPFRCIPGTRSVVTVTRRGVEIGPREPALLIAEVSGSSDHGTVIPAKPPLRHDKAYSPAAAQRVQRRAQV